MSRQSKMARKAARAIEVTAAHKAGKKIGRTKKLHRKLQIYPKARYQGYGANPRTTKELA